MVILTYYVPPYPLPYEHFVTIQGDCDDDTDCAGDLKCFNRDNGEDVPGCVGNTEKHARTRRDYCYSDTQVVTPNPTRSPVTSTSDPTVSPSLRPVTSNPTTSDPTVSPSLSPVITSSPTTSDPTLSPSKKPTPSVSLVFLSYLDY